MPVLGEINGNAAAAAAAAAGFPTRANPKTRPTPRKTPHKLAFKRQGSCSNPCLARDPNGGLGAYKVGKLLGSGSFGEVYLAHKGSKPVVLKRIPSEKAGKMYGPGGVATTKEIQYQKKLSFHPCVVQYLSHFEEQAHLYISLDFCSGGDLKNWASKNHGSFANGQILDFACQMALALKATHDQRIIHRDVKVHNFFITSSGRVKMGDWGFAQSMKGGSISHGIPGIADDPALMLYTQQGTPYYIAPEQCAGEPYNCKVDVWAFGCAIYELCTNRPPFQAGCASNLVLKILRACPSPVPSQYCSDVHLIISACLQREPMNRPSFDELLRLPCIRGRIATFLSPEEIYRDFSGESKEIVNGSGGSPIQRNMALPKWSKASGNTTVVYASKGQKSAARDGNACVHPGKYGEGCWYKGDINGNNKWHGTGIAVYPNGDVYSGSWKNDAWEGHGAFFGSDGESFIGQFKNDAKTADGRPASASEKEQILGVLEGSKGAVDLKTKRQRQDQALEMLASPVKASLGSSHSRMSPRNLGSSLKKNVMGLFKRNKGNFNVSSKRDSPAKKRGKSPKMARKVIAREHTQPPQEQRTEDFGTADGERARQQKQTESAPLPKGKIKTTKKHMFFNQKPKADGITRSTARERMEDEITQAREREMVHKKKQSTFKTHADAANMDKDKENAQKGVNVQASADVPFGLPIGATPLKFKTPSKKTARGSDAPAANEKIMTFRTPRSVKKDPAQFLAKTEQAKNPGRESQLLKFTPVKKGFTPMKPRIASVPHESSKPSTSVLKFTPKRPLPEQFSCSSPVSSPSAKVGVLNRGSSFDSVDLSSRMGGSISSSLQDVRTIGNRPKVKDSIIRFTPRSARYSVCGTKEDRAHWNRRTMSNPNLADSTSLDVDSFNSSSRSNSAWNLSKAARRPPTPPTAAVKKGDRVKIKKSVKTPRHGWGSRGVTHDSVGSIVRLLEDQTVAELKFSFISHFYCAVDELEIVSTSSQKKSAPPRHLLNL